ncbi:MAG: signal transduction histidine kinase [Planctomycetota bacterium]|jgi:signal transduction histidine kinase
MVVNTPRLLVRNGSFLLGIYVLVLLVGGDSSLGVLLASTALIAMGVERWGVGGEAAKSLEIVAAAAETEGKRDAIAQVMSLELAYERSRSVLEALGEGVLVVDEAGEIVLANPAANIAMAVRTREPVGRLLWEALSPDLAVRARDAFQAIRERSSNEEELPVIRYSGIPCYDRVFDMTAVEATSRRTGKNFGTVFLIVDSTRTHELQRIKDRFLSNVSHELRTPLTNICAYSEILCNMMPGESAEWPDFVRIINEEGVQLSDLVNGMFDFLQLESGEAVFTNEPLNGAEVVEKVVEVRKSKAKRRNITVAFEARESAPVLFADRTRLQQVTKHLLDNAIKFSPEGGTVSVTVSGRQEGWELRIEDTGPGIPVDDRDAVFEKFNQLPDQLTEKPSGTGIGLATSRAIVARFGGLIWCEDSSMGGASFVVLLPAEGQPKLAGFAAGTGAGGGF